MMLLGAVLFSIVVVAFFIYMAGVTPCHVGIHMNTYARTSFGLRKTCFRCSSCDEYYSDEFNIIWRDLRTGRRVDRFLEKELEETANSMDFLAARKKGEQINDDS